MSDAFPPLDRADFVMPEATGLLPAKWGAKCRHLDEYAGPFAGDAVPTLIALLTKETVGSGLDDGWFSNVWLRDQVNNANYTLGSEYDATTYPQLGTPQNYRVVPEWYESGDGGLTRGVSEFARRFFASGSRRFLKVGRWWYFPNLRGTPLRWDGAKADNATSSTHVIPSGPLPPTHAGTLAPGNLVSGELADVHVVPDSDVTVTSWKTEAGGTSNLWDSINQSPDGVHYIQSDAGANGRYEGGTVNLGIVPAVDSTVTIRYWARRATGNFYAGTGLRVSVIKATTVVAQSPALLLLTTTPTEYSFTLTPAQITAVGTTLADWNDVRLRFDVVGATATSYYAQVEFAGIDYAPAVAALEGSWQGSTRFLRAVAYRFEDGSVWAPSVPRVPSDDLPAGFAMTTVDAANPTGRFAYVKWSNIPIGPKGCTGRILLRSLSVDSTLPGEELKLNPYDLRVVWELTDNSTTEYLDYQADDLSLAEDASGSFIRYDHLMPPRARYIAGGDMRIVHAYGGRNPCAIEVAPVGRVADYDLNLADSDPALYASLGSYFRVNYSATFGNTLELVQSDRGATLHSLILSLTTYDTLQKLVDRINATSVATDTVQFRAQLCPGANPAAPSATCLTPHCRDIANVFTFTIGTPNITCASGASKIAVGTMVYSSRLAAGVYVKRIVSDTALELSGNATSSGTDTPFFWFDLGDTILAAPPFPTHVLGFQRVISNSLPGFIYFNASYLNEDPVDPSAVWMTVGTPGSFKSAPNSFSGKLANRFKPPTHAGIAMGGGAVDQGFVLPFSGGNYVLMNTRDTSSGIDEDYKLIERNPHRGCIAWATVAGGGRFVVFLTSEGYVAADLRSERLISEAIYQHGRIPLGSLSWEIAQCIAATAADTDGAYATARIMRSALWLNYRSGSSAAAHPDMQVVLDFSSGKDSNGLDALFRAANEPWGWSTRLLRSLTAMCEGRRADGGHLYGWNELNQGATGDGRVDEFEVGDADNGVVFDAEVRTPWERFGRTFEISGQEVVVEHRALPGSTVLLDFHRSYQDDVVTLTLTPTALDVLPELKLLPQRSRAATAAVCMGYRQTVGEASELRKLTLRAKKIPSYK